MSSPSVVFTGPPAGNNGDIDAVVGIATGNFTVTPNDLTGGLFTPWDGGKGGTFTPSSLMFNNSLVPQTFTYTPVNTGKIKISLIQPIGFNPVNVFTVDSLPAAATTATLSLLGPAIVQSGFATNPPFTISLDGYFEGMITLSDSGGGGAFNPPIIIYPNNSNVPDTFTYTPAQYTSQQTKSISITASPSLIISGSPISLTVNPTTPYQNPFTNVPTGVKYGGTGDSSFTAYSPICGGTTSTAALQSVSEAGAMSGFVLTFTGANSLPNWQAAGGGGGSVSSVAGDGTVLSNTPATGTVALALNNAAAYTILGNDTGSSAEPIYTYSQLGFSSYTTSPTLTASSPYVNLWNGTANGTITLPVASTCIGKSILVYNNSSHLLGLGTQGSDLLYYQSASSTGGGWQIAPWGSMIAQATGTNAWQIISMPTAVYGSGEPALAQGGLWYQGSGSVALLLTTAQGTAGQLIQSNVGSAPTWTSTPGSGTALTSVTALAINPNTAQTTVNGSSGSYTWSQPHQGTAYKKVIIYLNGYTNASTSAIVFTTAFTQTPIVSANGTTLTIVTISNTGVTIPISTAQTGFIILEGY